MRRVSLGLFKLPGFACARDQSFGMRFLQAVVIDGYGF